MDVYGHQSDEVPFDDPEAMQRRRILCRKLAVIIQRLAQPKAVIQALPDDYAAAIRHGLADERSKNESTPLSYDFDSTEDRCALPRVEVDP